MLPSASNKTKLFAEIFSLSAFPTRTNLKYLCKSQVAYEGLDSSKTPGLDLSGGSEELWAECSYILVDLLIMSLKESSFPDFWKVLSAVSVFKNIGERSAL